MTELLIAANPDPDSRLPYLLFVPLGDGIVLRTSGTWPRTKALYCYQVHPDEWPDEPDVVERVPLRSCARRGAAVEIVAARARENRSQLVFTTARGRDAVFWQSPRTRKQARPSVRLPSARAAGISELEIVVDSHERYAYRFAGQQVRVSRQALPCGDYGITLDGSLVAAVERKSFADFVSSLTSGRLRFALGELASLPRAAVVVEDRYSLVFKENRVRPAVVADGIAECQVHWPTVPIVFCETRGLAEEWTYRYLAAAHAWATAEPAAIERIGAPVLAARPASATATRAGTGTGITTTGTGTRSGTASTTGEPAPAAIRAWARAQGLEVSDRGRIAAPIRQAWERATAPME